VLTPSRIRCSFWPRKDIVASLTIAEATAGQVNLGKAMIWIRTPMIWSSMVQHLDLEDAVHVGHSTGGGEVARYIGRHGTERVSKAVLIGAVPPLMVKTPTNPGGLPIEVFDQSERASSRTGPNSGRISACRSTGTTGRAQKSLRECASHSGCKE